MGAGKAFRCGAGLSPTTCSPLVCGSNAESSDRMLAGLERLSDVCRAERLSAQLKSSGSRLWRSLLLSWRCRLPPGKLSAGELYKASRSFDTAKDKGARVTQAWLEVPGASQQMDMARLKLQLPTVDTCAPVGQVKPLQESLSCRWVDFLTVNSMGLRASVAFRLA